MNTTEKKLEGHAAMRAWDRTWKMHHIPMWAKKSLRKNAIRKKEWISAARCGHTFAHCYLDVDLFDHWGSVRRGAFRALVAQPYGNHDKLAKDFASEHGWVVKISEPGPWRDGTWLYEFLPAPEPESQPVNLA